MEQEQKNLQQSEAPKEVNPAPKKTRSKAKAEEPAKGFMFGKSKVTYN